MLYFEEHWRREGGREGGRQMREINRVGGSEERYQGEMEGGREG